LHKELPPSRHLFVSEYQPTRAATIGDNSNYKHFELHVVNKTVVLCDQLLI